MTTSTTTPNRRLISRCRFCFSLTNIRGFCYALGMKPVKTLITPELLEDLATRSNLRYGKAIAEDGEIQFTNKTNTFNLVADVKNGNKEKRTVHLMSTTKGFRWKCTCSNKKDLFCQHCVAVGFAAIEPKI